MLRRTKLVLVIAGAPAIRLEWQPHIERSLEGKPRPADIDGFTMKKNVWRAVIEVGFIIFLFYSNLLMGEFERSGMGQKRGIAWAIGDVFTAANFEIATIAALAGYILLEFLRKRF